MPVLSAAAGGVEGGSMVEGKVLDRRWAVNSESGDIRFRPIGDISICSARA